MITHDSMFTLTASLKAITEAPEAVISDVAAEKKKSFRIPVHVRHLISVNAENVSVKIGGTNGASDQPGDFPAEGVYFPSDINDSSITVTIISAQGYDLPHLKAVSDNDPYSLNIEGAEADIERKDNTIVITLFSTATAFTFLL